MNLRNLTVKFKKCCETTSCKTQTNYQTIQICICMRKFYLMSDDFKCEKVSLLKDFMDNIPRNSSKM